MSDLLNLFTKYAAKKNWKFQSTERSDRDLAFSELVSHVLISEKDEIGVKVLDWKKPVGVDQVHKLGAFCEHNQMNAILVCNKMGPCSPALCQKYGVVILTRQDLKDF